MGLSPPWLRPGVRHLIGESSFLFSRSNTEYRQAGGFEHTFCDTADPGLRAAVPLGGHSNGVTAAEEFAFLAAAILSDSDDALGDVVFSYQR